jgi:glycosyltransferase involved in cell wall biosynthesis
MVAFHFPPVEVSSGVQRTLRFVQHLLDHGWHPLVLSAHPRAYTHTSDDLLPQIPPGVIVKRAFALDAARHLAVAGRYAGFTARPDRWRAWELGAIPAGLALIREHRPDVIWSTYPIATAHLIAYRLHRLTGIPWIADFRDPMAQEGYPTDPRIWKAFQRIEQAAARHATRLVFVTPSALELYRARYPSVPAHRFVMIENGYDEESFVAAERALNPAPLNADCFTLLHSGIVYPSERDPRALFEALGRMKAGGRISSASLRLRFRAPRHPELLHQLATRSGTEDLVEILPPLPYRDALQEMLQSDGLLVMQGANCNEQIPAKLYEYFRARRPILGLADPDGDTGKVMREAGVPVIARLEDAQAVEAALDRYLGEVHAGDGPVLLSPATLSAMSRRARAGALAELLDAAREEVRSGAANSRKRAAC